MGTNYDKLKMEIGSNHNPFIVYDVETTGIMNGNDNHITQISLVAYAYNRDNDKYELQDQLFMLAKPDEQVIRTLQKADKARIENPEQTIKDRLIDDYIYSLVKKEPDEKKQKAICDKRSLYEDYCALDARGFARLSDKILAISNDPSNDTFHEGIICEGFVRFCNSCGRLNKKTAEVKKEMTVEQILAKQGLDLEKYIADGKGLTPAEMQVGITEFLNKYHAPNTVLVNNGTHFTKHYMEKENLSFLGHADDADKVIDLIQVQRSMRGGNVHFKKETGREIKLFDALTKGLCLGEITVTACDMSVSLTSEKYLANKVAKSAMSKDNDYVVSNARASAMNWIPVSQHAFDIADFHFNSLEYVDFGNDRRYVDIDKMFEMNDNFEITLEGEKEPIKTWEQLETKIKALNSKISDSLLEKIHEKYEEISRKAEEEHLEDFEFSELKPVTSEREKAEALIKQLQAIRKENKDLSKGMSELETKGKTIFRELSSLAYTLVPAIQDIREKIGVDIMKNMSMTNEALIAHNAICNIKSVSIPIGRVDVELILYNTEKDKSEQRVKLWVVDRYGTSYDENSIGIMKCLVENDITKNNIASQFWCNVAHHVRTVIKKESIATDKLREDVKDMISFTKDDVDMDKKAQTQNKKKQYSTHFHIESALFLSEFML